LVFYCRTTSASTAPRTPRRTCCPYAYVLATVPRVSSSCENFPDGFDLHLLHKSAKVEEFPKVEAESGGVISFRRGRRRSPGRPSRTRPEREFFIDNLLVRIHFIIVMIRWTGLAPWEFESPFPGSLTSTTDQFPKMEAKKPGEAFSNETSSTSNTNAAFGGIAAPAPVP